MTTCSWCGANAEEKAAKFEGPHATWCVHFRSSQRGGPNGGLPRGLTGNRATLMITDEIDAHLGAQNAQNGRGS